MRSCAVFANLYDTPLGDYQTFDIINALEFLYSRSVDKFYIAENRRFERFCKRILDGKRNSYMPPETHSLSNSDPYEQCLSGAHGRPDIFFADFILCDETTINFVKNNMNVKYIVEFPKTRVYTVAKDS